MTPRRLQDIATRLEAATKGKWELHAGRSEEPNEVWIDAPAGESRIGYKSWQGMIVCFGAEDDPIVGDAVALANAEFIVNAKADIAAMLEYIGQLEAERVVNRIEQAERNERAKVLTIGSRKSKL
jgi:hypothetical protein